MRKPIIGVTVGTPISPKRVEKDIKPIKTINNVNPDENGNVELAPNNIGASPTGHTHTKSQITDFPTGGTDDLEAHVNDTSNPHGVTAAQAGADASGTAASAVATHNTATSAHNDIRLLIEALATRLNTLADSDDTTLDQMSEIVTYIKSNKSLIDSITTSKVNVSDIINNLTTNVTNKPLSAAQGVAIKALIDALQTAVNGKAANTHTHTKSEITDLTTETWTFTLEDGSTVTKAVYVG